MFTRATINLSASAKASKHDSGVKFQLRFSFKSQMTSAMIMVREAVMQQLGISGDLVCPVEVAFGEANDWGRVRLRRTEQGQVSNSLARPAHQTKSKEGRLFYVPLGHQGIFVNQRVPATSCEWKLIHDQSEVWLELVVPSEAMNFARKPQATAPAKLDNGYGQATSKPVVASSRKEILQKIGKMSV